METLWFCLVAFLIAGYVILDGFDIGAGILHLFVARTHEQRRQVLESIGPFWDGNEVWLVAAAGTIYLAFPVLYAASFSGFYLPLIIVLWLLMFRGLAIELRNHLSAPVWIPFWDAVFAGSSVLLAVFYGVALGNVIRGVPLNAEGEFFLPLWTTFRVSGDVGILDWYTILVGVLAVAALAMHGALWVAYKTSGPVEARARTAALASSSAVILLTGLVTFFTFRVQALVLFSFSSRPWIYLFALLPLAALAGVWLSMRKVGAALAPFLWSCLYLAAMLSSAAAGIYPYVLPAVSGPARSLTIFNASAGKPGLATGLVWWIPGMALACAYVWFLYRRFAGKVSVRAET